MIGNEERIAKLRQKAEDKIKKHLFKIDGIPDLYIDKIIHELQVYQIELEMQTEELVQSQRVLLHTQERYADLFDNAPIGYIVLNEKGNILEGNRTFIKMVDERISHAVDFKKPFAIYCCDANDTNKFFTKLKEVFRFKKKLSFELKIRSSLNKILNVEMECILVEERGAEYCRACIIDIQDRIKVRLLQKEQELQNAQKLESLAILAAGLAHDFKNILNNINLQLQLLKEENISTLIPLELLEEDINRGKNLAESLMTFTKEEVIEKKLLPSVDFIKKTVNFSITGSNIKCQYNIPAGLWDFEASEQQIFQVINNIVINALDAMNHKGTLIVSAENHEIQNKLYGLSIGKYVKIIIEDDGPGIKKEDINKIFDPYFTSKESGHGLGLATAYSIISKHGGRITVDSEINKGAKFTIYLPVSEKLIQQ